MSEPTFVKIDDTGIGVVEFAVDLADLQQEKFYTKTENGDLTLWTFAETGRWEGQKVDIDIRDSVFVINKDFFVGKSCENVTSKTIEHVLLRYHGNDNTAERIVTFDDSITALAINVDGSLLVASTENNKVYILRKKEAKYEICDQLNVNGVPLSLSIDPNNELVAVATTEGAVRVYTLNNVSDTSVMGADFVSFFTSVTFSNSSKQRRFCPVWSPNGIYMFVPTYVGIMVICTIRKTNYFSYQSPSKFDKVAISPNGLYLAGISDEGSALYVFCMETETCILKTLLPNNISAFVFDLIFCPRNNDVLILAIENNPLIMVFNACQKKEPIPQVEEVSSDESDNASYESDSISFHYSFPTADQEFIAAQAEVISSLREQVDEYAEEIASLTCSLLKATGKFSIVGVIQAYADKKKFDLNSFNDWTTIFNEDKPITALRTSLQCDLSSQHFTDALTAILQKPAALQTNSSTESGSIVVKKSDFTRMELFTIKLICNALLLKVIVE